MAESIRAFIAISIPDGVAHAIGRMQTGLRDLGLRGRWVRPENIHLTLKFLGDIQTGDTGRVLETLDAVAGRFPAFSLSARGLGVFPGVARPRVLWVGPGDRGTTLADLHKALEADLAGIGFQKEARPFAGHLTIGRFKERVDPKKLAEALRRFADFDAGSFAVDRLHLYKSDLRPTGAVYTRLGSVQLADTPQ